MILLNTILQYIVRETPEAILTKKLKVNTYGSGKNLKKSLMF